METTVADTFKTPISVLLIDTAAYTMAAMRCQVITANTGLKQPI